MFTSAILHENILLFEVEREKDHQLSTNCEDEFIIEHYQNRDLPRTTGKVMIINVK